MNLPKMTDEQIESLPVWKRFVGLWPETRKDIAEVIIAARDAQVQAALAEQEPVAMHDSDCSTNNRGVPELLGPCDCSHQTHSAFEDFANRRYAPKGYQPERDGDGYKADAWQLAWEAWSEASREMDDMRRAYELLFAENARLRDRETNFFDSLKQAVYIIDGALYCGFELNKIGEERLQKIRDLYASFLAAAPSPSPSAVQQLSEAQIDDVLDKYWVKVAGTKAVLHPLGLVAEVLRLAGVGIVTPKEPTDAD